ncbi:MAG: hypothetical protein QW175_05370 [Candidatus Bathyarchaeia archaeon]
MVIMVAKTVSGDVLLDTAIVGNFTITYEDDRGARMAETKVTRTLTITVLVGTTEVGSATLSYEDLIASGAGGKRTITLKGDVEV